MACHCSCMAVVCACMVCSCLKMTTKTTNPAAIPIPSITLKTRSNFSHFVTSFHVSLECFSFSGRCSAVGIDGGFGGFSDLDLSFIVGGCIGLSSTCSP